MQELALIFDPATNTFTIERLTYRGEFRQNGDEVKNPRSQKQMSDDAEEEEEDEGEVDDFMEDDNSDEDDDE